MSRSHRWTGQLSVAASVLAVAALLATWSGWRALTIEPVIPPASGSSAAALPDLTPRPATPANLLRVAVAADPFRPDREPASVAFRMPGETATASPAAPPAQLFLVGTAMLPDGKSFAMCRVGDEQAKVVRLGDRIGTYTLRSVEQGRAVFQTAQGSTLEVRVPKAGS